jgi:hypothetical protein
MRPDGDAKDQKSGLWVVQFGWRNQSGEDVLSPEMLCYTLQNSISILPEARGAIVIHKTLVMMPIVYLTQTKISQLQNVREYISLQQSHALNDASASIVPQRLFELLVDDLVAIHGSNAPGLPTLANFIAAGDNYLNIDAIAAFNEWITQPLKELSNLNKITNEEIASNTHVRRWISDWLGQNGMALYPVPLRVFNGGLGFLITYASKNVDVPVTNTYQTSLDKNVRDAAAYRYTWSPILSILDSNSIIENATFSFESGMYTAPAIEGLSNLLKLKAGENPAVATSGTDDPEEETLDESHKADSRSLYLELLKVPNKRASLQIMGQPKLSIMDMIPVDAGNDLYTGLYTILAIIHTIDPQGFTTDIDCFRSHPSLDATVAGLEHGEP